MKTYIPVLTIAGSDSGGGAGIQADLKTFAALGCYGMSVLTATTAQNTKGVRDIHSIPVDHIKAQLDAVMEDIPPLAIKLGMLDRPEVVEVLAERLKDRKSIPIIFDPVMVASSGDRLIRDETIIALKELLIPITTLLTPNLDEAEILSKIHIKDLEDMKQAAEMIQKQRAKAVLVKGGHLKGDQIFDVLLESGGKQTVFEGPYIETQNVHGTGCTLSAAIASEMAKGAPLTTAVEMARLFVQTALERGKDVKTGHGAGPLNHFFKPLKQITHDLD
ncbi:bifunctional hydroxymethylpyrimidine kinase/phosphomethylpyrimidine kinase [Pararhodonellum marinum]|uniref:bifunctional hydroxymethylpyrimidine kinase/phosphomethylpyrimidine kinase n=1 Tax=Pararhodonellum marinum TaxID=2755358 RepID=UPI00188FEFB8|nr:bifunctional hydroxymethylpyrimidine kinase/phosphomethylpyrimidine kinase [Pararhodonellum marinum]